MHVCVCVYIYIYPPPCLRGTFGVFGSPSRFMTCHFMTLPHLIYLLTPFNYNFFTIKGAHKVFSRRCGGLSHGSCMALARLWGPPNQLIFNVPFKRPKWSKLVPKKVAMGSQKCAKIRPKTTKSKLKKQSERKIGQCHKNTIFTIL